MEKDLYYIEDGYYCTNCELVYTDNYFKCDICRAELESFNNLCRRDSFMMDLIDKKIQLCIRASPSGYKPLYYKNENKFYEIEDKANKLNINLKDYINGTKITRIISKELRYKILKEQKWKCNMCGEILIMSKNSTWKGEIAHIDHIHTCNNRYNYPKGAEFINERENLQALCKKCNLHKNRNNN